MLNSLYRYGNQITSHDAIKVIALTFMVMDHLGSFFFLDESWWRVWGRGAAPLFFFLVGYTGKIRHLNTLFIYGIILSGYNILVLGHPYGNILLSFLLINAFLPSVCAHHFTPVKLFVILMFLGIVNYWANDYFEYGTLGILLALCGRLCHDQNRYYVPFLLTTLVVYAGYQIAEFHWWLSVSEVTVLLALVGGLFGVMWGYQIKTFPLKGGIVPPLLVVSRYSLHLYFFHYLLFIAISLIRV